MSNSSCSVYKVTSSGKEATPTRWPALSWKQPHRVVGSMELTGLSTATVQSRPPNQTGQRAADTPFFVGERGPRWKENAHFQLSQECSMLPSHSPRGSRVGEEPSREDAESLGSCWAMALGSSRPAASTGSPSGGCCSQEQAGHSDKVWAPNAQCC